MPRSSRSNESNRNGTASGRRKSLVKELVTDANFECNEKSIHLQAMDNTHIALVSVLLHTNGFVSYRCDYPLPLGVNLGSLSKVLKCVKDNDVCTLKALDTLYFIYDAKRECYGVLDWRMLSEPAPSLDSDRVAEYDMKLMDIDLDVLGILDTEYDARTTMPLTEFARIVRELSSLGESVRIDVSKEGVRFTCDDEAASASILLRRSEESGAIGRIKRMKPKEA